MIDVMDRGSGQEVLGDRVIYNFVPIERTMTLTIEEFRSLVNHYGYGHPYRLCFLLMGCCGLRSAEVTEIKLQDFSEECKSLTYVIKKTNNSKKYKTGTVSNTYRTRTVKIYDSLRTELLFYISNNYHLFKDRYVFPFSKDSLRRYLSKLRIKAKEDKLVCPVLKNLLLDQETMRYGFGSNVQPAYRFALHSFRRFFLTYYYHVLADKDVLMTQLEIGHQLKETTMIYIKRAADIGLTPELIAKKLSFESLIYEDDQRTLNEY